MIQFSLFILLIMTSLSLGMRAFQKRSCLSLLTQFRVERELTHQVGKSHSLKVPRLYLKHLKDCHSPILNSDKETSRTLRGQKIQFKIGGKIEDHK